MTTVRRPAPVWLHRPRVALVIMRARLSTRSRVDVIKHELLQLDVLDGADRHGHIHDPPFDILEAGGFGRGAGVAPEMNRFEYVPWLEGVPS